MGNAGESMIKCLRKREEAINRHKARKEEFLIKKKQIVTDIEEARKIWENALDQLPEQVF